MIKTKDYNNISRDIEKKFQLRPGETVTFEYTRKKPDPHPDSLLGYFMPEMFIVPPKTQFYDPILEEVVDIAAIKRVGEKGKVVFSDIKFRRKEAGILALSGDKPEHMNIYTYLMLHPWNETSPHRPPSAPVYFRLQQPEVDAERRRQNRSIRYEAMKTAMEMPQSRVRKLAAALGLDPRGPIQVLREAVENHADNYPQGFLNLAGSSQTNIKADVNLAFRGDIGILRYIAKNRRVIWAADKTRILTVAPGKDYKESTFDYIINNEAGAALYERIQKALEDAMPETEEAVVEEEKKKVTVKPGTKKSMKTVKIE